MNTLRQIRYFLSVFERALLVFLLSIIILFSFLQLFLRQFFSIGFSWIDVFLRHLVLWIGFLGAVIATDEGRHFSIDILKKFLQPPLKKWVEIMTDIFALICLLFLTESGIKFFKDEWSSHSILFTIGEIQVPAFFLDGIIPVGFLLLFIHFFLKMVEDIFTAVSRKIEPPSS